ncbi:MAG: hypothetical protein M3Z25_01460 [Actinomycetota bacterium]|nr:hypothetical protein [Actinomycetota bacterium]
MTTSPRRRLALTAGSVLAAGSLVCAAALCGQHPRGGPMGSETAEGGHPTEEHSRPQPSVGADAPTGTRHQRQVRFTLAVQVNHAPRATNPSPLLAPAPARGAVRRSDACAPAGSALSSLTPAIGPVGTLLGQLPWGPSDRVA